MLGWLSFIRSIKIFGISMQFIRSANELKMVHNEKYVEYYLKFQKRKKKLHQKCHWSLVSLVHYNIRLSCCVPEKNQFEKRQFPNRRQKFNRGIFLEYVWRMEYQSKVERKDKNNIECIWFSNAPSLVDFFSSIFGRQNRICRASTLWDKYNAIHTKYDYSFIWLCTFFS